MGWVLASLGSAALFAGVSVLDKRILACPESARYCCRTNRATVTTQFFSDPPDGQALRR